VRLAIAVLACAGGVARAQTPSALEGQLSNPIATLANVGVDNDFERGGGPDDHGARYTLTARALLPIRISPDWYAVSRSQVPVIVQRRLTGRHARIAGLSNATQSMFLAPATPRERGLVWGVGPIAGLPASDAALGSGGFSLGVTAAVVEAGDPVTVSLLVSQLWPLGQGGAGALVEPELGCALGPGGTELRVSSETTYDWTTGRWTVPVYAVLARLVYVRRQPIDLALGPIVYLERGGDIPRYGVRASITLVLPK
jgi:hypothetical protein